MSTKAKEDVAEVQGDSVVKVFGDVDRNSKGEIGSEMPCWYYEQQTNKLKENIEHNKFRVNQGAIDSNYMPQLLEEIKREEKRLDEIISSKPKLSQVLKDVLADIHTELGEKIQEAMFTYSEQKRGIVNTHHEASRISEPCITVRGNILKFCKDCGVKIYERGQVNRGGAEKAWKIAGRLLGENTNTEVLRKVE